MSLLAIEALEELSIENAGSERAPETPRGVRAGPAARIRSVRVPEPGPM